MGKTDLWPVTSMQLFYSLASNIWLKSLSVAFVISCFTVLQLYAIPWFLTMYARKLEFESCSFFHEICLIEKILQTFYLQGFNTLVFCWFFFFSWMVSFTFYISWERFDETKLSQMSQWVSYVLTITKSLWLFNNHADMN